MKKMTERLARWILLSLLLALALAGCGRSTAVPTPTTLPTATPAVQPMATPTPVPTATPVEPIPTAVDPGQVELLTWQREGGLAGLCDNGTVFADGGVRLASCRGQEETTDRLSDADADRVAGWVERLAPFEHVQSDGAVADGMTVRLTFAGQGTQAASEADVQAMLEFAASLLPTPQAPANAVLQTGVRYVLANEDVPMHAGPGADYPQIGELFGGQVAWVTGISVDGTWWRVICPDETVGNCWLTADRELVFPTTPPGAWPVYTFPIGASVDYPAGWSYAPDVYDEAQYSAWFHVPEMDRLPVGVEVYHRPVSERDVADPFTWQPNEGGYEVHWSRPIASAQGLVGLEFVWGAYSEPQKAWDTPPQWMAVYYSPEHELDVRLIASFDQAALDLLETSGVTETVAAHFGLPRRMAQSIRLHPTTGWNRYQDAKADGLFELKHPPEWTVEAGSIECGISYGLDSLKLLVFEGCRVDRAGGARLTFFETLHGFRNSLGDATGSARAVDGMRVEVIHYSAAGENGILTLDPGPGTVAFWQVGEQGFALIDEGNRRQADGTFDGVLGTFRLLPPMPRAQPRPLEGRALEGGLAFDLPGVGTTLVLPEGYRVLTNNEYNRRGSLVSFDLTAADRAAPYLGEIQFFSESSLRTFQERCDAAGGGFCFEGDYPDLERFQTFQAAIDACTAPAPYEARQFGGHCYLVSNHRCTGDACVLREYTTFLDDRMVSLIVVQQNASQASASDELFASFEILEPTVVTQAPNDNSFAPRISADGRYVAFVSWADNLVEEDTNERPDVFVYDHHTGQVARVSVASDGTQSDGFSGAPATSADGHWIAFASGAKSLDPAHTDWEWGVFVHELGTGQTERIQVTEKGSRNGHTSTSPSLSADGRYVTFTALPSEQEGPWQVHVYDRGTKQSEPVSVGPDGTLGDGWSTWPAISADGRYVAFWSRAGNLVADDDRACGQADEPLSCGDVFVYDRQAHTMERIPVGEGEGLGGGGYELSISNDGRYVVFRGSIYDRQTQVLAPVCGLDADAQSTVQASVMSADGRWVAFTDGQVYLCDLQNGAMTPVSVAPDGTPADGPSGIEYGHEGYSGNLNLSADGRWLVFASQAGNLIPGEDKDSRCQRPLAIIPDMPHCYDVYLYDRETGAMGRIGVP